MSTSSRPADGLRRAGLVSHNDHFPGTGEVVRYQPAGAFYVDGIRYTNSGCHVRAIAEIMQPHQCHSDVCPAGARMYHNRPPTEEELDRWVRDGRSLRLPGFLR